MFKKPKPTALSRSQSTMTAQKPMAGRSGAVAQKRPSTNGSKYMVGGAPHMKSPVKASGAMNSYRTSKVVSAKTHSTPMSKKPIRSGKYV